MAAVLKTVDPNGFGGSNPSLSAKQKKNRCQARLSTDFSFALHRPAAGGEGCRSTQCDEIPESEGRLSAIAIAGLLPSGQSGVLPDKVSQNRLFSGKRPFLRTNRVFSSLSPAKNLYLCVKLPNYPANHFRKSQIIRNFATLLRLSFGGKDRKTRLTAVHKPMQKHKPMPMQKPMQTQE